MPNFEAHVIKIGRPSASDDGGRADVVRNAVFPRELVEAANRIEQHVLDHQLGEVLKRKAVDTRSQTLLKRAIGTFNFADVRVGRDDV